MLWMQACESQAADKETTPDGESEDHTYTASRYQCDAPICIDASVLFILLSLFLIIIPLSLAGETLRPIHLIDEEDYWHFVKATISTKGCLPLVSTIHDSISHEGFFLNVKRHFIFLKWSIYRRPLGAKPSHSELRCSKGSSTRRSAPV